MAACDCSIAYKLSKIVTPHTSLLRSQVARSTSRFLERVLPSLTKALVIARPRRALILADEEVGRANPVAALPNIALVGVVAGGLLGVRDQELPCPVTRVGAAVRPTALLDLAAEIRVALGLRGIRDQIKAVGAADGVAEIRALAEIYKYVHG